METKSFKRKRQAGQALIMVTVGVSFLLGLMGLVVDIGYGYYVKQVEQAAVDSAATAAAAAATAAGTTCTTAVPCQTGYTCPSSPTNATAFGVACLYAQKNGMSSQTVTISSGTGTPPSAPGVNTSYWVTVTASQHQSLGFLSAMGFTGGNIQASATGAVTSSGSGGGGCIYVMDSLLNQSLTVSGSSSSINSNCGIYVNSTSSSALSVTGGATVTASAIDVVGGASISGSTVTPTPVTGTTPVADPFASLPAPTYTGTCDHTSYTFNGGTTTIGPGNYCNGIKISGTSNVTFTAGTYFLNGGGLSISGGHTTVYGSGVTFYNFSSGYSAGPILMQGGTATTLTAPTSGTYQGILFYTDRTLTSSSQNTISGGSTGNLSGSVYMLKQQLVFSGGSTSGPLTMAIVCDQFTVSGASYLAKDTTGTKTGIGGGGSKASLVQ